MDMKKIFKTVILSLVLLTAEAKATSYTVNTVTFPDPRGGNTYAYAINDNGLVAGSYSVYHATEGFGFIYNAGAFTQLSAPDSSGAYGGTFTTAINNNGAVAGYYYSTALNKNIGYIYNGSSYTPIDATALNFNRTTLTTTSGVNDNGFVVGNFTDYATGAQSGLLYNGSYPSMLVAPGTAVTTVNGINNAGLIIGSVLDANNHFRGFIFDGSSYSIINAPNASDTFFRGISNNGLILGNYQDATGTHNFVLNNGIYESIDLPQLNGSSIELYGINSSGQIVGTAYGGSSGAYGFVLSPVPLPSAAYLFAPSLLGLASLRRRSKVSN